MTKGLTLLVHLAVVLLMVAYPASAQLETGAEIIGTWAYLPDETYTITFYAEGTAWVTDPSDPSSLLLARYTFDDARALVLTYANGPVETYEVTIADDRMVMKAMSDGTAYPYVRVRRTSTPQLLFVRDSAMGNALYTINADGSGETPLTAGLNGSFVYPSWSPDGTQIGATFSADDMNWDVIHLDLATGEYDQLTEGGTNWAGSWSPDGTQLLYWTDPPAAAIHLVDLKGEAMILIGDGETRLNPALSPNGSQIVSMKQVPNAGFELFLYDLRTREETPLTPGYLSVSLSTAPWSPGGTQIVFASERDGDFEIYVVDVETLRIRQITDNAGISDDMPAWSPDGTQIAFASSRDGDFEIYVMDMDGEQVVQLTNNDVGDVSPVWKPG